MKATVFVDDAVLGQLPGVCARTGERADGVFRIDAQVRSPGRVALLLLLFLGPIGWIILLFAWIAAAPERVHCRVPYTKAAVSRERFLANSRTAALVATIVLIFFAISGGLSALEIPELWTVLAAAAFVVTCVLQVWVELDRVRLSIDGSRRWITLSGVHPNFAEAVRATQSRRAADTPLI